MATVLGLSDAAMAELQQTTAFGGPSRAYRLYVDVILPFGPALYVAILFVAGGVLNFEHYVVAAGSLIFRFGSRQTKSILVAAGPLILILWANDAMRYIRPLFVSPQRVVGCSFRNLDLVLFGVAPNVTLSDYFAVHHHIALDLYFAIPYGIFIAVTAFYSVYLYFRDRPRLDSYLWSLALIHTIVFAIWLAFPVAPPWYLREHGCAIIAGALPSPAALARVDQYLGIHYFQHFYGRAADVFGAFPSLHCSFPAVGLLTAWRAATWRTWPFHLLYVLSMFVASIYLGHHWVIDGLAGWLIALFSVIAVGALTRLWQDRVARP